MPRDKIQLATKFGIVKYDLDSVVINGSPEYVRESCEASLRRLDVDYIDLYYQHRVDKSVPIEDTVSDFCVFLVSLFVCLDCLLFDCWISLCVFFVRLGS